MGVILALALAAACGTVANVKPGAEPALGDAASVVVLGVATAVRIQAYLGWRDGKEWEQNALAKAAINTVPKDGYAVVPIAPTRKGEAYGILRVVPSIAAGAGVCTGGTAAVFEVPAGKVVYAGDVAYRRDDEHRLAVTHDFAKARAFVQRAYPKLAGALVDGRARAAKVRGGYCGGARLYVEVK